MFSDSPASYSGSSYNMNKQLEKTRDDLEWESYWDTYQKEAKAMHRRRGGNQSMRIDPTNVRDKWTLDRMRVRQEQENDSRRAGMAATQKRFAQKPGLYTGRRGFFS